MAYLACAISGIRVLEVSEPTLPVTDQEQAIATSAADSTESESAQLRHAADPTGLNRQLARLRYAAMTQALPAPSGPVPAVKLRAFKEDNSEKLRRCRIFLDDKLADLAAVTTLTVRVKAAQIMEELEDDVKSLQELMNKRGGGLLLRSLVSVVSWVPHSRQRSLWRRVAVRSRWDSASAQECYRRGCWIRGR